MSVRVLVMTIVGLDQPGIVDKVARVIANHRGNWEESRMARLAGTFAGILKVSVDSSYAHGLQQAVEALGSSGLDVSVRDAHEVTGIRSDAARHLKLELVGADHEGIVRDVSRVLADRMINIEDLATETVEAPMASQRLFKANLALNCPMTLELRELKRALERLADDLMVEISLAEEAKRT